MVDTKLSREELVSLLNDHRKALGYELWSMNDVTGVTRTKLELLLRAVEQKAQYGEDYWEFNGDNKPKAQEGECFVCGHPPNDPANPVKVKRFQVMYYWCVDPICKRCWGLEGCELKDGEWDDPDFDQETGKEVQEC